MYIDPNTGGVIFQALAAFLGIFVGLALTFSSKIRASIAKFRRRGKEEEQETNNQE